jgi:hypothetical protein
MFNLGSIYTMSAGGSLGFYSLHLDSNAPRSNGFWIGPELSVLTLRFGDKRQYEVATRGAWALAQGVRRGGDEREMVPLLQVSLMFTALFLPDVAPR